jgi:hypothetical protein
VSVPEFTDADPNGCDPSDADPNGCAVRVADENEEEEEDEIPLTRKNSWRYVASGESSEVPSRRRVGVIPGSVPRLIDLGARS